MPENTASEHVAASPPCGVFISYRRSDAGPYARLLKVQLDKHLPGMPVFMDLDSIEAGIDSSAILVALIGPKWLTIRDGKGRRRLDAPDDFVRFEIRTALEGGVRVIPVLVDGAKIPKREQLPADLATLARLNALQMSYERFEYDESRLIAVIRK